MAHVDPSKQKALKEAAMAQARSLGLLVEAGVQPGVEQNLDLLLSHYQVVCAELDSAEAEDT